MQSRLDWTGQQKQSSAPVSFVVAWKHLRCGLRCGCGSGGGGLLFGFRVWGDFFIAGDREEPSTGSYLIQVRGTRGAAGIGDVPGLGEFSGLPAPVIAAGQVFTGRQCSVAYTRSRRESTKRSFGRGGKGKNQFIRKAGQCILPRVVSSQWRSTYQWQLHSVGLSSLFVPVFTSNPL